MMSGPRGLVVEDAMCVIDREGGGADVTAAEGIQFSLSLHHASAAGEQHQV